MQDSKLLNKDFAFYVPFKKSYQSEKDGYMHVAFSISSLNPDLQYQQMTEKALTEISYQAKGLSVDGTELLKHLSDAQLEKMGINIDDNHTPGLKSLIGPVTDSWIDENDQVWVDLRVRKEWEPTIRDLVDSETQLGGSIQGKATEILPDDGTGIEKINGVQLFKAALTDTPAAWDTRGSFQEVIDGCPGSMCCQIMKSMDMDLEKCMPNDPEGQVLYELYKDLLE